MRKRLAVLASAVAVVAAIAVPNASAVSWHSMQSAVSWHSDATSSTTDGARWS